MCKVCPEPQCWARPTMHCRNGIARAEICNPQSTLLLERQVVGAIAGDLTDDLILAVDCSLKHLAKAGHQHHVTARRHISAEREALPREIGTTAGDGQRWRGLLHAGLRAS